MRISRTSRDLLIFVCFLCFSVVGTATASWQLPDLSRVFDPVRQEHQREVMGALIDPAKNPLAHLSPVDVVQVVAPYLTHPTSVPKAAFRYADFLEREFVSPRVETGTIDSDKTPVILVAGHSASAASLATAKEVFEGAGYPVYLQPDTPNVRSLEEIAADVAAVADAVEGPKQFVTHSMGGLTLLTLLRDYPAIAAETKQAVLLAPPLGGSPAADLMPGVAMYPYLQENSPRRAALLTDTADYHGRLTVIRASWDELIPDHSAQLATAAANVRLPVEGHTTLLFDEDVLEDVAAYLAD